VEALNRDFTDRGLEPIELRPAEEHLEDEDLLELVNAGMLPWVVVDEHKAQFWADVMGGLTVRDDLAVRTGGSIGWAFRKGSPQLAEVVNDFVRQHRQGTLYGNVILKRYLESNPWIRNNLETSEQRKVDQVLPLFLKYGERYGLPPVILLAMGYQESQLDQSKRSRAGAVGVMQIKPSTAADPNVGITGVDQLENNIHAAAKYLAFLRDRYFSDPEITEFNQVFLTLAAYNAGPARVRQLRNEAAAEGLDPNVWFGEVEQVAARRIGRETVHYVSNIAKYAFAYRLVYGEKLSALSAE
jgi:membrane-bound lytic murein transglycosylase MltF